MSLESIISITGKPGLFKTISQTKNGLIVEALLDKKRMPVYASDKVSALEDISIYTTSEEVPLKEVYDKLYSTTDGKEAINHKSSPEELRAYLLEILPDLDSDRVYNSDVKKLFQWYNILIKAKVLKPEKKEKKEPAKKEANTTNKKAITKKDASKKPTAKKATKPNSKPKAQKSTPKKAGKK